jgi:hypothetical protein
VSCLNWGCRECRFHKQTYKCKIAGPGICNEYGRSLGLRDRAISCGIARLSPCTDNQHQDLALRSRHLANVSTTSLIPLFLRLAAPRAWNPGRLFLRISQSIRLCGSQGCVGSRNGPTPVLCQIHFVYKFFHYSICLVNLGLGPGRTWRLFLAVAPEISKKKPLSVGTGTNRCPSLLLVVEELDLLA